MSVTTARPEVRLAPVDGPANGLAKGPARGVVKGPARGPAKGQRAKHVPRRMCVACRAHDAKRGLIRVVRTPEGAVALDPTGKRNGRGAYLCHRPVCWDRALRTGALARALNVPIDDDTAVLLRAHAETLRPEETADRPSTPDSGGR